MAETNDTHSNTQKDPDDWVTGGEPMTGAQTSYLRTLSGEAGEEFNENLTKAEASKRIDELQEKTGRGKSNDGASDGNSNQGQASREAETEQGRQLEEGAENPG